MVDDPNHQNQPSQPSQPYNHEKDNGNGNENKRRQRLDELFVRFVICLLIILMLYGAGILILAFVGDDAIASKMVNFFTPMFTAVIGLGSGYLLGR